MKRNSVLAFMLLVGLLIGLGRATQVEAGVWDADSEVTYKEYWMNHSQFTGGCNDDGTPSKPNGAEFVEPGKFNECRKEMKIDLNDIFINAIKAEVYIDLGSSSLMQYLFQPMIDSFNRSFREG